MKYMNAKTTKIFGQEIKNNIVHACNGGEIKLNMNGKLIKVDGFDKTTNIIYQFHGCFWHGCPKCFDPNTINKKNQHKMKELYEIR